MHHDQDNGLEDDYTESKLEDTEQRQEEEEEGGFGGFGEALPNLDASRTPQIRQDSDTEWGATELPPSKWDEHLNAPPKWQTFDTEGEDGVRDLDANDADEPTSDPWRPAEASRRHDSHSASTNEGDSQRSIDIRRVSAEQAEMDLEKLQNELGIQIRNLDEEYAKQGKSPTISEKSPTLTAPNSSNNRSRWSLWGAKRSTNAATNTTTGSEDGGSGSRRGSSVDAKDSNTATSAAMSPRSSISTAGIGSAASSSAPQTPDVHSESKQTPSSGTAVAQEQQQQQAGVSRFFRFGKGRANSADPSASTSNNDSSMPSVSSATVKESSNPSSAVEITDDFGQLENFDSKRSTSANGVHSIKDSVSGYDDFGSDGLSKEDDEPQRRRWFWNRNNNSRVVDYSNEEEQDLDKVFSAFSEAPPTSSSASKSSNLNRVPSLRSQGMLASSSNSNQRRIIPGGKEDPFAHLSAAASSIRSSASMDPFDPLDPLAELNQASNITARVYKDRPSPSIPSRSQTVSPPALPPPPSYSDNTNSKRPVSTSSTLLRPASGPLKSTTTPPPLLAPPAPLSSISSTRKPTSPTSLLDDLADLSFTDHKPNLQAITSPASGQGPKISQAPQPIKPPINNQTSVNILEDDFGDFETATTEQQQQGTRSSINSSPKKAGGPMKLTSKVPTIPSFLDNQSGSQTARGSKKNDADFFDLL